MKDYYYILGLPKNCTHEEIRKAHRKLSKKFHPDVNDGDNFFSERFKDIMEGYEILSSNSKRKLYDVQLKAFTGSSKDLNSLKKEMEDRFAQELKAKEDEFRKKYWTEVQIAEFEEKEKSKKEDSIKRARLIKLKSQFSSLKLEWKKQSEKIDNLNSEIGKVKLRIKNIIREMDSIEMNIESIEGIKEVMLSIELENTLNEIPYRIPTNTLSDFVNELVDYAVFKRISTFFVKREKKLYELIVESDSLSFQIKQLINEKSTVHSQVDSLKDKIYNYLVKL